MLDGTEMYSAEIGLCFSKTKEKYSFIFYWGFYKNSIIIDFVFSRNFYFYKIDCESFISYTFNSFNCIKVSSRSRSSVFKFGSEETSL